MNYCSDCGGKLNVAEDSPAPNERLIPIYECSSCTKRYYSNPTVGVAVIYLKDNKILLGKRNSQYQYGKWCIPCGHLDPFEPVEIGARREFYEETSLEALNLKLFHARTNPNNTVGLYYYTSWVKGEPKANDDLSELGFFDFDNLPELAFQSDVHVINRLRKEIKKHDTHKPFPN